MEQFKVRREVMLMVPLAWRGAGRWKVMTGRQQQHAMEPFKVRREVMLIETMGWRGDAESSKSLPKTPNG
jgi:hypothetical protein